MKGARRGRAEWPVPAGTEGSRPRGVASPAGASQDVVEQAREGLAGPGRTWPGWARVVASMAIIYHLTGVVAGALGVAPSSVLERSVADLFSPYYDLVDFGYAYRFYTEPPPTPVVTATLYFGEGQAEETVRLPGRRVAGPRMRHQRQLALANALFLDVRAAQERTGDRGRSRLARAYARHLCASRPGCARVTLHLAFHLIPDIEEVREAIERPGAPPFDLFAESLFSTPEWIGEFPCGGS